MLVRTSIVVWRRDVLLLEIASVIYHAGSENSALFILEKDVRNVKASRCRGSVRAGSLLGEAQSGRNSGAAFQRQTSRMAPLGTPSLRTMHLFVPVTSMLRHNLRCDRTVAAEPGSWSVGRGEFRIGA
jgi:hypothetical protein